MGPREIDGILMVGQCFCPDLVILYSTGLKTTVVRGKQATMNQNDLRRKFPSWKFHNRQSMCMLMVIYDNAFPMH